VALALLFFPVFLANERHGTKLPNSLHDRYPLSPANQVLLTEFPELAVEPKPEVLPATDCPKTKLRFPDADESDRRQKRHFATAAQLAQTADAEYLLASAMIYKGYDLQRTFELLEKAAALSPTNKLVSWTQLRHCRDTEDVQCDLNAVAANAVNVDSSNGTILVEVALLKLADNEPDEAADLIRRAIAATRFDNYFIDYAMMFERAFATQGDASYTERMVDGIGYSAAIAFKYLQITSHCKLIEESNVEWLQLCDQLGQRMFAVADDLLGKAVGKKLSVIAADRSGNAALKAVAEGDYQKFKQNYRSLILGREGTVLLENSETTFRQYVDNLSTYGEMVALRRLRDEVGRIKNSPDVDQCILERRSYGR
jgi:tetratricopeptide (TPR) repeat protein